MSALCLQAVDDETVTCQVDVLPYGTRLQFIVCRTALKSLLCTQLLFSIVHHPFYAGHNLGMLRNMTEQNVRDNSGMVDTAVLDGDPTTVTQILYTNLEKVREEYRTVHEGYICIEP